MWSKITHAYPTKAPDCRRPINLFQLVFIAELFRCLKNFKFIRKHNETATSFKFFIGRLP